MEQLGKFFGVLILMTTLLFAGAFSYGFLLLKSYQWFIIGVFNAPVITYYQAVGIALFITLFHGGSPEREDEDQTERIIKALVKPWVMLGCFWVIYVAIY